MQLRPVLTIAALAAALALAGCTSSDEPAAAPTDIPTTTASASDDSDLDAPLPEPTSDTATYASVEELATAAGCTDFAATDSPEGATAAGTCGSHFTYLLFASGADRDTFVNADQATSKPSTFLIGANWVVQLGPDGEFDDLQPLLESIGGFVVPTGS